MTMRVVRVAAVAPSPPRTMVAFSTCTGPACASTPLPEFIVACMLVVAPLPLKHPVRAGVARRTRAATAATWMRFTGATVAKAWGLSRAAPPSGAGIRSAGPW